MLGPVGSSAGRSPITCAPSSSSTPCRWRWPGAAQFVSLAFGQAAPDAGIAVSMGSKGDCFDNAVAESFFATLKKELVRRRTWPTRRELIGEVFDYLEAFYNRVRRHSTLGMLAPLEFENSTLSDHRPSLAASQLGSSQDQIINH